MPPKIKTSQQVKLEKETFNEYCHVLLVPDNLEKICKVWDGEMNDDMTGALPAYYATVATESTVVTEIITLVVDVGTKIQKAAMEAKGDFDQVADVKTRELVIKLLLEYGHKHIDSHLAHKLWNFAAKGSGDFDFMKVFDRFNKLYPEKEAGASSSSEDKATQDHGAYFRLIESHLSGYCDIFGDMIQKETVAAALAKDGSPTCILDSTKPEVINIFRILDRYETLYFGGMFYLAISDLADKVTKVNKDRNAEEVEADFQKFNDSARPIFQRLAGIGAHRMAMSSYSILTNKATTDIRLKILKEMTDYFRKVVNVEGMPVQMQTEEFEYPWRKYVRRLHLLKQSAKFSQATVMDDLKKFSSGTMSLLHDMYEEAMAFQSRPVIRMSLVALGSLSIGTMGPTSDIEYDVITSDVQGDFRQSNIVESEESVRKSLHVSHLVHFEWTIINFVLGFELDSQGVPKPKGVLTFQKRTESLRDGLSSMDKFQQARNELLSWLQCDLIWSNDHGALYQRHREWAYEFVRKNGPTLARLFLNSLRQSDVYHLADESEMIYKRAKLAQQLLVFAVNIVSFSTGFLPWNTETAITELHRRRTITSKARVGLTRRLCQIYFLKLNARNPNLDEAQRDDLIAKVNGISQELEYLYFNDLGSYVNDMAPEYVQVSEFVERINRLDRAPIPTTR